MLAQGMPVNAAIIGVYLHGLTADTYSWNRTQFIASDIISNIGEPL
jgi:NAD(P)H-hydrate repair Nnr-like enzyme with NAD(P)H-hydrate dehydratase domain